MLLAAYALVPTEARAETLVIITSYPPAFFEPLHKAFRARNPDTQVTVVQRNTASAIRAILDKKSPADLFWASSPDAFERLKAEGALRPSGLPKRSGPQQIAGYPLDDPDGTYVGFALSRYGVLYDPAYLGQLGLKPPARWEDLLSPAYIGHVGMTTPSRSGTTHLMIETMLQRYGWPRGWAMLSRLGGNLSTITARSFGVASGVSQRRFGIGMTIDFLAELPSNSASLPVFVGVEPAILAPANVAMLAQGENPEAARRFVQFLLSRDGQLLLLDSAIKRIPVDPELSSQFARASVGEVPLFDAVLSARRYEIVNLIFDELVVRRRPALERLWTRVEQLGTPDLGAAGEATAAAARALLEQPPLDEAAVARLAALPRNSWQPSVTRTPEQAAAVTELRNGIDHNLAEAERLLNSIVEGPP